MYSQLPVRIEVPQDRVTATEILPLAIVKASQRDKHEPTCRVSTLARSRPYKGSSMSRPHSDKLNPGKTLVDARGQLRTRAGRRARLSTAVSLETAGLPRLAQLNRTDPCLA
jgi:hypothetical protein